MIVKHYLTLLYVENFFLFVFRQLETFFHRLSTGYPQNCINRLVQFFATTFFVRAKNMFTRGNTEQIISALDLLMAPGQLTELRVLGVHLEGETRPCVFSGFYDEWDCLADDALKIEHIASGCYFMPNPLDRTITRLSNSLTRTTAPLASKANILTRRFFLIDVDNQGVKGESATEQEREDALTLTRQIWGELSAVRGWPDPVYASSGNGGHLLYRIEELVEDDGLLKNALWSLASMFDGGYGSVDKKVHNPARIWKLYGTLARKGSNTEERPHRRAEILKAPPSLEVVPTALIRDLAGEIKKKTHTVDLSANFKKSKKKAHQSRHFEPSPFDLDEWLERTGLSHTLGKWRPTEKGRKAIFDVCPFNMEHNDRSAVLFDNRGGSPAFYCQHNSCDGNDFPALRDLVDPEWRYKKETFNQLDENKEENIQQNSEKVDHSKDKEKTTSVTVTIDDVDRMLVALEEESSIPELDKPFSRSDLGNSKRLKFWHGRDLHYCYPWKQWLCWDGKIWKVDEMGQINRRYREMLQLMREQELPLFPRGDEEDNQERKKFFQFLGSCESVSKMKNAIESLKSEEGIAVMPESLDEDLFFFNCQNGTIDLRIGRLLEHDRSKLQTKISPVSYNRRAKCPKWENFLSQIFNKDGDLCRYVQKCVGYSLSGSIEEQCFFILYGSGQNGKSTFLDTLRFILGDYYEAAAFTTFLKGGDDGPRADIASLRGARFVSASESEDGQRLDEPLVKSITGGDMIKCRSLYKDFFQFMPQFKIWLSTNHLPRISRGGKGMWRRVRLIPFLVTIKDEEIDRELPNKLLEEAEGILAWCVEGVKLWNREGLGLPESVKRATGKYAKNQDVVGLFIDDCCEVDDHFHEPVGDMYKSYANWAISNGEYKLSNRRFGSILNDKGFEKVRDNFGYRQWQGIRCKIELNEDYDELKNG